MNATPPVVLEPFYYLDNFHDLLNCVEQQYADLLSDNEILFLQTFRALTKSEQAYLVRLYSRRGILFRSDKTFYDELPDPASLIPSLEQGDFIQINPQSETDALLALANRSELKRWWPDQSGHLKSSAKRSDLLEALQGLDSDGYYAAVPYTVIFVNHQELIDLFLLLFFGHPYQDLTSWVTTELGHVTYEDYGLDSEKRLFGNRKDIENAQRLMVLKELFYSIETFTEEMALLLLGQLPDIEPDSPLRGRHDRFCNRIARELERCEASELALLTYQRSSLPPSRERQARIWFKENAGKDNAGFLKAIEICDDIIANPCHEAEENFARQFKFRCQKKCGQPVKVVSPFKPATETIKIPQLDQRVEETAASYLTEQLGGTCYWVENWLFNAVFGLTFWEAIFTSVRGAFTHPFQVAPHDLYDPAFTGRRNEFIEEGYARIDSPDWKQAVTDKYEAKFGVSNPFVGWYEASLPPLITAIERIPTPHWKVVFERLWADLKENRSGFPDLIHFPDDDQSYKLYEVKSPTDKIQPNQLRWMQYFQQHNIPCVLLQVQWQ